MYVYLSKCMYEQSIYVCVSCCYILTYIHFNIYPITSSYPFFPIQFFQANNCKIFNEEGGNYYDSAVQFERVVIEAFSDSTSGGGESSSSSSGSGKDRGERVDRGEREKDRQSRGGGGGDSQSQSQSQSP